jgi:UDP-N-acetylmuramate--alanine ligase
VSGVNQSQHVHFIGIGGYGMSAIANVMLDLGIRVSGSDVAQNALTDKLVERGATVYLGHAAHHIDGADSVVYSTACSQDNVEIVAARERNIPILHRAQALAELMNVRSGIAVAGAHGKTTTTSMISYVMEYCGLDPTFLVGGVVSDLGVNAKAGKGEYLVAEADESDGTFLNYRPKIAIVTNIEADHLENYDGSFEKLKAAYQEFLGNIQPDGLAVVCADDEHIRKFIPGINSRIKTYGIDEQANLTAKSIELIDRGSHSVIHSDGKRLGRLTLSVPGTHNIANALACIAVCMEAGLPFKKVAEALRHFHGAKRRFQVISDKHDILVIDDYAHHPTEIQATIEAARATGKRIIAVFQPQRYTRTFHLFDQFTRSFAHADEVVITNIYSPAGERQIEGVTSERLTELIYKNSNPNVRYLATKEDVYNYLVQRVRSGDLVLTMGAGDIWKVAHQLAAEFENGWIPDVVEA